ncbi:MAG: type II secretion system protein [Verrucomicrobiota bacterium]
MISTPISPFHRRPAQAFTIIELLVVVTIIAILASLSVMAYGNVTAKAKQVKCMSNMRQIGTALTLYAADNNMNLPETTHTASITNAWIYQLDDYFQNVDEVRICPADPLGPERLKAKGTSYVLNSYVFVAQMDPFGMPIGESLNNLNRLEDPSQTILAFIVSEDWPPGVTSDHTHSRRWTNWSNVTKDIAPDRHRSGKPNDDHTKGSSNYLFADGHVENWKATYVKEQIENGINIAEPPQLRK